MLLLLRLFLLELLVHLLGIRVELVQCCLVLERVELSAGMRNCCALWSQNSLDLIGFDDARDIGVGDLS